MAVVLAVLVLVVRVVVVGLGLDRTGVLGQFATQMVVIAFLCIGILVETNIFIMATQIMFVVVVVGVTLCILLKDVLQLEHYATVQDHTVTNVKEMGTWTNL
jgi:hypothetical protein